MKRTFCSVLLAFTILSLVSPGRFFSVPVHAAGTPVLSISPPNRPLAAPGSTVTYDVNVSNISPSHGLGGWEVYVQADSKVLNPVNFTVSSSVGPGFESVHCVNNIGTGCNSIDAFGFGGSGLGMVHSAFSPFNPMSGNFTLFTITYNAVAGPYSLLTFLRPSADTSLFEYGTGNPISFTAANGSYGNVPLLPVASFTWTPLRPFQGENVTFDASSSYDPNGRSIVSYSWNFAVANNIVPHIFASGVVVKEIFDHGNWTATLTVTNDLGVSSSTFHVFFVTPTVIRDLAVSIYPNLGILGILPGSIQNLEVIVINVGTTTETRFNVSLSVPGLVFRPPPYPALLPPMQVAVFRFIWDTTGVSPGTYTVHAHLDPLLNETNTSNNDASIPVTFVPYLLFTPNPDIPILLTQPHGPTVNVTLETGSGFTGTITLSALSSPPLGSQGRLSIKLVKSSVSMGPNSFATITIKFLFDKKTTPGDYLVTVVATSGSFTARGVFFVAVP